MIVQEHRQLTDPGPARTMVVSVGTDHHPFDRLMGWVAQWLATAPPDVRAVVQHGVSRRPARSVGHAVLPRAEFLDLVARAQLVIVHGGSSSIMEALAGGHRPIAVPRLRKLGEAVDDHQVTFCRRMQEAGNVVLVESEAEFAATVDAMLADPGLSSARIDNAHVACSVDLVGGLIDELIARPRRDLRRMLRRAGP